MGFDNKKAVQIIFRERGSSHAVAAALSDPRSVETMVANANENLIGVDTPKARASIVKQLNMCTKELGE